MPVQINEVIIRTVINPSGNGPEDANNCAPGNTDGTGSTMSGVENDMAEQIIEILKEKKQR